MGKKQLTLKEKQKEEKQQIKDKKKEEKLIRDVGILRSLIQANVVDGVINFNGIDSQLVRDELTSLRAIYPIAVDGGIDKLKFLIISIIDIIHDAHGSRVGATTQVAHLLLFKLVVCNIFEISENLYEYIYTRVVPVTQNVLQKFIEVNNPACTAIDAPTYFTQKSTNQISLRRVQPLQGLQPQPLSVTTILRDNVGVGTTLRLHIETLGFQIVYAKTPSIVLDSVSVPMDTRYDYTLLDNSISTSSGHIVDNELFPGRVIFQVTGTYEHNYNATIQYIPPAAPGAPTPPILTFPWNPTIRPPVGYKPIDCTHIPPTITLNPTTCLPPNNTKNCAFSVACHLHPNQGILNNQEYINEANTRLRERLEIVAQGIRGFQPLTLEQYILCKLIGDYSYCLYYNTGDLNFVTTSDIISGLRLFSKGVAVLFSIGSQSFVFYDSMNFNAVNAPLVGQNLPHVTNTIAQKQKEVKERVKKNLQTKVKGKINNPGKTTNLKPKIPKKAQIVRRKRLSRNDQTMQLRPHYGVNKNLLSGGQLESELSVFDKTLTEYVDTNWFNTEPSELIKPVNNPPISDENLKLLVEALKTQFKKFDDQLKEFEKKETKFFMSTSSGVDYKSSCDKIIAYLKNIIGIMSSPECIRAFTESCKEKSYGECIKSMSSYVVMFPFIFDESTKNWYLNYTYPFSVCFNEYILSLLNLSDSESKYPEIFKFVTNLKTISRSKLTSTPLDYGKIMPFNDAVTFVILNECNGKGTKILQEFVDENKLYNEQSRLQLTEFDDISLQHFLSGFVVELGQYEDTSSEGDEHNDEVKEDEDVKEDNKEYNKLVDDFFQDFVVDNNILYEDFVKKLVSFLIPNDNIIRESVFSVIKFILLFQNFDNIALCSYTVVKTIIESLLTHKYSSKSFAAINNEFNMLFYYSNLYNFFQDVPEVVTKIKETRAEQNKTSIDDLSILEKNISIKIDLYSYCLDYALSNFYDQLYDDKIDSELTFETTDEYVNFQMEKLQKCIDAQVEKYLSYDEELEQSGKLIDTGRLHALSLNKVTETHQFQNALPAGMGGGKNNRISNPKHNTKYRKNYKKFVSKYIIKKKKNNNKNNNKNNKKKNKKNNKNKTRKNKRLTKSTPNTKRNNKTLKNKKGKSKSNNHKSKYNKKTKTNYYNSYRHNKTLKH